MEDKLQNALTGTASVLVGLPFDVVTLRLQTGAGSPRGVLATLRGLARKEGLRSLGKGGVPALTTSGLNRLCNSGEDILSDSYSVKTEGALQCLATTATAVPENIKSKLQFQRGQGQYRGMLHCASTVAKTEGVKGLFAGYSALLLRDVPLTVFMAARYVSWAKEEYPSTSVNGTEDAWYMARAALSVLAAHVATYPADVIKAHMQTAAAENKLTLRGTARMLYRQHGVRAFYRGFSAWALSGMVPRAAALAIAASIQQTQDSGR